MKFRVSSRDLLIFGIFCFILLYLCSIAVVNFISFGEQGEFSGLNPFPGFMGDNLPVTLTLFFIALIVIFSSVSSYIFDKEKSGFGFKIGEKDGKGYSRWAKDYEMKKASKVEMVIPLDNVAKAAGAPLINTGKKIWVDNGEYHSLVIGSSGSGKTECVVKPMVNLLAKKGESMVITDPKGEIYRYGADYLRQQGYNVILLNFRETQNGNAWNPLTLPYQYYKNSNVDKSTELLDDVALNILYDPNNKGEPFWEKSAADYFSGLALGLFQDAKIEEINLNSINYMSTVGEEKFAASNYAKEYFSLKGESSSPYVFASNTINAPVETKGGILSVFRQKIRLFSSRENLSEMLSYSDFDMRTIGAEKTAVFIVIHDEKTTYHALATIFIKQCYESLIDVAQENGGKLPFRTNFILDEFANMPPLKDVDAMVTAARSRLIRFTLIIQNYAQLNDVYGKEVAEVIKGNCGNTIYLISTELAALEEISKMCGDVQSAEKDKTSSTPLVTVTDLQKMKLFEAIIKRLRMDPFKTKLTPDFKMEWGIKRELANYPVRERKEIQLFDIKAFVKEKKRQKMLDSLDSTTPTMNDFENPFAMPGQMDRNRDVKPQSIDIDAVIKDIDRKIAELDAEEAKQKAMLNKSDNNKEKLAKLQDQKQPPKEEVGPNEALDIFGSPPTSIEKVVPEEEKPKKETIVIPGNKADLLDNLASANYNIYNEEVKNQAPKVEEKILPPKKEQQEDLPKPKINVDVDSVIVNDSVVSDDEFFDDFFGE